MGDKKSGTIYDGGLRDKTSKGGSTNIGTGKGTEYWDDDYRYTRDPQKGDHWTDQGKSKGSSTRHDPPPDVKKK